MHNKFDIHAWVNTLRDEFWDTQYLEDVPLEAYVEFDRFREEYQSILTIEAGFNLPFNEDISIFEFHDILTSLKDFDVDSSSLREEAKIVSNEYTKHFTLSELLELKVHFPCEEDLSDLIEEILDNYGVPDGTGYEFEGDLPDELCYLTQNPGTDNFDI